MKIIDCKTNICKIEISNDKQKTLISFSPETKELKFNDDNELSNFLIANEYQIRKILHNKRPKTFYKGFQVKFALRDKKEVEAFNDRSKIIVLDKRKGNYKNYVKDKGLKKIYELYTDGCFLEKDKSGGYAALIKSPEGNYNIYSYKTEIKSSCLIELLAAIEGLQILKNQEKIRIITDSQYVRKGLTEWIINWELNDWHTANGEKVKNIKYWKLFDSLTNGKYIEFCWVKAHSNHFENTICDFFAKKMAEKNNYRISK